MNQLPDMNAKDSAVQNAVEFGIRLIQLVGFKIKVQIGGGVKIMSNNIRRDRTQTTRAQRSDWEVNTIVNDETANREAEKQEELLRSWENIYSSGDSARIAEYELARRISAATEGDSSAYRTAEVIKDFKRAEIINDEMVKAQPHGQSVDEFSQELSRFDTQYKRAVKKAYEAVK